MIEVKVEYNGKRKVTLHPPEEDDVKALDLILSKAKTLTVTKIGADYVLTPTETNS